VLWGIFTGSYKYDKLFATILVLWAALVLIVTRERNSKRKKKTEASASMIPYWQLLIAASGWFSADVSSNKALFGRKANVQRSDSVSTVLECERNVLGCCNRSSYQGASPRILFFSVCLLDGELQRPGTVHFSCTVLEHSTCGTTWHRNVLYCTSTTLWVDIPSLRASRFSHTFSVALVR